MENRFELTKEIMGKAETYVPIAMKEMIASDSARACIKPTNLIHPHDMSATELTYGLQPVYCESPSAKARIMMTILMVFYLKEWDDSHQLMSDAEEYDKIASSHIINQIERYKSGEYREKAFDILSDFKETERYLNSAIYSVLRELNDPVKRFMEAMGDISSYEGIQRTLDSIKQSQEKIEEERERQEQIINGEEEDRDG